MKLSQSNFNLRSSDCYWVLITTLTWVVKFLKPSLSTSSNMDRQILCHLFRQIICFVL